MCIQYITVHDIILRIYLKSLRHRISDGCAIEISGNLYTDKLGVLGACSPRIILNVEITSGTLLSHTLLKNGNSDAFSCQWNAGCPVILSSDEQSFRSCIFKATTPKLLGL